MCDTRNQTVTIFSSPVLPDVFVSAEPAERATGTAPEPVMTDAPEALAKGDETILIVDDDKMIREFGRTLLNHLGYTVLVACDAAEGLAILERERPKVRLVLLDLLMTGMSGREMYEKVRETDSDIRFVIISGLDFHTARDMFEVLDESWYIMKPFGIHTLSRAVRDAIDRKTAP